MLNKKGDGFPVKVMVVIILILLVLFITLLVVNGTFREVFSSLSNYLNYAKEGNPNLPESITSLFQ